MATGIKIALIVEYDGTCYHGFQLQANAPTIQGEIEESLLKLTGQKSRINGASRTDAGVHAKGQVASVRTRSSLPLQTFVKGLNYYLPEDIAVKEAFRISDSFDVRRRAIGREYTYHIVNSSTRSPLRRGSAHLVSDNLDIEAMNQACQALIGKHNFASFATCLKDKTKSTVRNMHKVEVSRDGELVTLNMVANAFLPHQVRNTVGALIRVGQGKMTVDDFNAMFLAQSPGLAGPTAPACGLYLMKINYQSPLGVDAS